MAAPPIDDLATALYRAASLLARRIRQAPAPGDLALPERSALSRLDQLGPATGAELARVEQITPQAMATTLGGLERRGLIERHPDPHDGRRIIASLTGAGVEVLRHKRDARAQQLAKALAERFTGAELEALAAAVPLIERLGESL